jgi:hypothetical protein
VVDRQLLTPDRPDSTDQHYILKQPFYQAAFILSATGRIPLCHIVVSLPSAAKLCQTITIKRLQLLNPLNPLNLFNFLTLNFEA